MRLLLLTGILCCFSLIGSAQKVSPGKLKKAALANYEAGNWKLAAQQYETYLTYNLDDLDATYRLASWLEKMGDYPAAALYYKRVAGAKTKRGPATEKFPRAKYDLARMLKANGSFTEALRLFEESRKEYREFNREVFLEELEDQVEGVLLTLDVMGKKNAIRMTPLTNTYSYGFPVVEKERLLLIAAPDSFAKEKDLRSFGPEGSFWAGGQFKEGEARISGPAPDWSGCAECKTTNLYWFPERQQLYYTRCDTNPAPGTNACQIYVRKRLGHRAVWNDETPLPPSINLSGSTNTQPCVVKRRDGVTLLYFSSDRPGGFGGFDIWHSQWNNQKNQWSEPVNAGDQINSYFDEITPFYHIETGNLYYSSDRRIGMGGMDIFKSVRGELPSLLPPPFNSTSHDTYFWLDDNSETGFLTSTRDLPEARTPGGHRQIYAFEDRQNKVPIEIAILKNTNHKMLNRGVVQVYGIEPETERTYLVLNDTVEDRKEVTFSLPPDHNYKLVVRGRGYFKQVDALSTMGLGPNLKVRKEFFLIKIPVEPKVMNNVYYEFGSAELTPESYPVLDSTLYDFLVREPDLIVEIGAHTDNIGSAEANIKLSQERAESVVKYLISKGIESKRLRAKGYGEDFPIAPNTLPDGSDDPIGRQLNRRTEFKVTGEL